MPRLRRRHLLGLALGGVLAPAAARAATVGGAAIGRAGPAARLSLAIEGEQRWRVTAAAEPERLVLHLPGATWRGPAALRGAGPVRAARFVAADDLLVIELAGPALAAPGPARDGHLVLDIAPVPPARFAAAVRAGRDVVAGQVRPARALPLVVLDPGHGGRDPGAIGTEGTEEKRIVLSTALELKQRLEAARTCRVLLTRTRDVFVPLAERVEIARRRDADLFVSLHADSAPGARGASVYTLSETASDAMSDALARRENRADLAGGLRLPSVSPEVQRILISLMRQETRAGSARLARLAVRELGEDVPLLPNTHREASFVVLKAPEIPSALVELGFLSDPRDEAALRRPEHRARLAGALSRAIGGWLAAPG
ncbi:N-acetylmuramoyl-L-alanine amidase [Roseomonas sp. PWR1]|uniref:N-acetylmuramoyl-L-alanine amidase n=1 Tax=Roseomonas nitratireducens TaxID=2820810 RepID=A0ABS4AWZ0_9PROT|nr:N-acetylmuramoyl-L-alanine amidase [Neoroseomonas nitratireducens]MBP0465343.1 N-acetylmuramoyl-L-alanine amidase [Neoroseomonas nitratireducens]